MDLIEGQDSEGVSLATISGGMALRTFLILYIS